MNIADKIIKDCSLNSAMLTDFELAEQLAVDAFIRSQEEVKFYFEDGSVMTFIRKDGLWVNYSQGITL